MHQEEYVCFRVRGQNTPSQVKETRKLVTSSQRFKNFGTVAENPAGTDATRSRSALSSVTRGGQERAGSVGTMEFRLTTPTVRRIERECTREDRNHVKPGSCGPPSSAGLVPNSQAAWVVADGCTARPNARCPTLNNKTNAVLGTWNRKVYV